MEYPLSKHDLFPILSVSRYSITAIATNPDEDQNLLTLNAVEISAVFEPTKGIKRGHQAPY